MGPWEGGVANLCAQRGCLLELCKVFLLLAAFQPSQHGTAGHAPDHTPTHTAQGKGCIAAHLRVGECVQ